VLYSVYLCIRDLYYTALDNGYTDTSVFRQIKRYWDLIHEAKEHMDDDQKDFVDFYFSRNPNVAEIEKRFDLDIVVSSFNIIRDTFRANNELGYGVDADNGVIAAKSMQNPDNESAEGKSDTPKPTTKRDIPLRTSNHQLQPYLDIVKLVADNEMRYVKRFGLNLDVEELYSIGILAVQVFIKNKTSEQLASYNSAYFSTVITWAIRNELRIRYKKYSQSSTVLDFRADDAKSSVRMTVYYVLKDLYNNYQGLINSKVMQEINEVLESINKAKSKLSGSDLECAEYFFDKNPIPADISARYSTSQIIDMLDAIKRECKDNDTIQKY
jgi:hypothetical protein